jgi:hypothetical protein
LSNASLSLHPRKTAISAARSFVLAPAASRTILLLVVAAAVAISLRSLGSDAPVRAGSDLTNLLRFMAALKAVLAVGALAGVFWRLAAPATLSRLAVYAIASGAMAAGPGLIWGMDHVALGALLLHGGLVASIVLLWRDPASASLLSKAVTYRARSR